MSGQVPAATEVLRSRHRDRIEVRQFRLVVTGGPDAGRVHDSRGERAVIGSHETADLRLEDRAVSRFHCEVSLGDDAVRLRDLGSLNGTYVNRQRIDVAALAGGDEVQIGKFRLLYLAGARAGGEEPAAAR